MKNIKFILPALGLLIFSSCMDQFLDVKPVGKLIPAKASEFENLLFNEGTVQIQFMDNNRGNFAAYLADNLYMSDAVDEYYNPSFVNLERYAGYVFYSPITNPNMPQMQWQKLYASASIFNAVVEGIEGLGASEKDTDYARGVMAAAKAARAWAYMNGAFFWGPGWDPDGRNDTPVIPYRTASSPLVANPPRNTTAEIFELLKTDLEYAEQHISAVVANPSRANKAAVYALMAQMYMYQRNWAEMARYADLAWQAALANAGGDVGKLIYDFNDLRYIDKSVSPIPGEDRETYLSLGYFPDGQYMEKEPLTQPANREVLLYREACWINETVLPSEDYIALFDAGKDMRYKLFMLNAKVVGGEVGKRYMRMSKFSNGCTQGLSYPEVLILRAEAYARTNDLPKALADLNLLRKYRYVTGQSDLPGGEALTRDQLLEEILKERRRELPLVSCHRLFDLKRFSFDTGKPWCVTQIVHKIGASQTYTASITDPIFNAPISNNVIDFNPAWGLERDTRAYKPK